MHCPITLLEMCTVKYHLLCWIVCAIDICSPLTVDIQAVTRVQGSYNGAKSNQDGMVTEVNQLIAFYKFASFVMWPVLN